MAVGFWCGFVCTQLACAGWALGSTYARRRARRQKEEPTLTAPAFEMLFGGIVLLGWQPADRRTVACRQSRARSAGAVVYLVVFGSIVAFSAYRYALQHLPIATVSLYVYVNTVIAVVARDARAGEPFELAMGGGRRGGTCGNRAGQKTAERLRS